jgi:hypothetical protein
MGAERVGKYRAEIARLDGELQHYDQQWTTVPHFAWSALLAPIAGYWAGWGAAVAALLVAAALVGVRAYLIAMRKSEVSWNRERLVEDLRAESE